MTSISKVPLAKLSKAPTYDLIIIDGKHLAYRSYYAYISLKTTKGIASGMVYGFLSLLKQYKENYGKAKHKVVIAWEGGKKQVRNAILPSYKDNRPTVVKAGFHEQMVDLRELLQYLGIGQYMAQGYEGDDVIYYLAKMYSERNRDVLIISGDKDLRQQVREREDDIGCIHVLYPKTAHKKTDDLLKVADVTKMYQLKYCAQLAVLLALCGDKTDNIPKVDSFNEKKAQQFIQDVTKKCHPSMPTLKDYVKVLQRMPFKDVDEIVSKFKQNFELTDLSMLYERDVEGRLIDRRMSIPSAVGAQMLFNKYEITKIKVEHF